MLLNRSIFLFFILVNGFAAGNSAHRDSVCVIQNLQVSENRRFLQYKDGSPFFWLGDTAWLLFQKLNREEARIYLQDRYEKGFNVIQVMIIHDLPDTNFYGDPAFIDRDPTKPFTTPGCSFQDSIAYDYWDHTQQTPDDILGHNTPLPGNTGPYMQPMNRQCGSQAAGLLLEGEFRPRGGGREWVGADPVG